jgi:hypothetical protein
MAWVLRLVETGIDSPARVIDVMDIRPLGGLGDIAQLGLTLSEAKQILARLQQVVVTVQADDHAVLRPNCSSCDQACHGHRQVVVFGTAKGTSVVEGGDHAAIATSVTSAQVVNA